MSYEICFQLPDVKNFIYGDFESKYERTVFKKVPGAPPVAIFYTQSGKELERVNLEKFDRYVCYIYSFFYGYLVFGWVWVQVLCQSIQSICHVHKTSVRRS